MGCQTSGRNRKDIIKCLIKVPADEIVNKEIGVADSTLNYSPFVITKDYNKFINTEPKILIEEMMLANDTRGGAVLIGGNKQEGSKALMYYLPRMFPKQELEVEGLSRAMFEEAISKTFDKTMSKEVNLIIF